MAKDSVKQKFGRFGKIGEQKSFPNSYILKNIILPKAAEIPNIVLIVAPCRSGTSTLLKAFSASADMSYYQPLKSLMRTGRPELVIPKKAKTIVIKETLGPWRMEESIMDPLALLLKAGVPKEKIVLIPLLREPVEAYDSWLKYAAGTDTRLFIAAFDTTLKIHEEASKLGIRSIPLAYDLYKKPRTLMKSLLGKVGLKFKETNVRWKDKSYISKKIKLNDEAAHQKGYASAVLSSVGEFRYIGREIEFASEKEMTELSKKLSKRYKSFLKMSEKALF